MTKDYYKILEITEFSSTEDIKKAYRALARRWHPDVAGSSAEVVEKFKEINEAYTILSDSAKKTSYDKARKFYNYAKEKGSSSKSYSSSTTNPKSSVNSEYSKNSFWNDIFSSSKTYTQKQPKAPQKGDDILADVEISAYESILGVTKTINMLQTQICPKCSGRKFVNGSQCTHCQGKGELSIYKKFNVKIPAGIKDGSKIRLSGEGNKGIFGGQNGDLYLTIHIIENTNYKIEGLNILKQIFITPPEAVLGASIKVATVQGPVLLKIAPNTKSGQKIRLSGCGIEQYNKVGDMIVTVAIQIPQNLTNEEISLYKKLQEISGNIDYSRERLD